MTRTLVLLPALAIALLGAMSAPARAQIDPALQVVIDGPQRSDANRARDAFRHPGAELTFFGIRPEMSVVEIYPGGGWWTEILAPYLKERGIYIVSQPAPSMLGAEGSAAIDRFAAKLAADPALYGKVKVTRLDPDNSAIAPAGTVDMVLTFRNLHNWMAEGDEVAVLRGFYAALRPGGTLGIEDHRANADQPQDPKAKNGYVRQDYAIALAASVGFKFVASSEVNANPKDTKDYPAGVWTLPPTLRLGEQDKQKYLAIGESDCFVLKFIKPE